MNWTDAQAAIVTWLRFSGLTVLWSYQSVPKQPLDFIQVRAAGVSVVGQDDILQEEDDSRHGNGTTTVGTEIELRTTGMRILRLSVQVHTARPVLDAVSTLSRVQTALRLESVRSTLMAVGLAPFDLGEVRDISAVADAGYEGRAVMDCQFYFTEKLSDFVTYIETAPVQNYMGPPGLGTLDDIDI